MQGLTFLPRMSDRGRRVKIWALLHVGMGALLTGTTPGLAGPHAGQCDHRGALRQSGETPDSCGRHTAETHTGRDIVEGTLPEPVLGTVEPCCSRGHRVPVSSCPPRPGTSHGHSGVAATTGRHIHELRPCPRYHAAACRSLSAESVCTETLFFPCQPSHTGGHISDDLLPPLHTEESCFGRQRSGV